MCVTKKRMNHHCFQCLQNTDPGFLKINNLILKSDWDLISPYSIAAASNIMVTRIRKMIANLRSS